MSVMEPDIALTLTENVLRDLIVEVLTAKHGPEWIQKCVDEDTRSTWNERREDERSRRAGVKVDERLIYYAELSDLHRLFKSDWEAFKPCLGSWKTMDLYLKRLISFRNPKRHGRDLLPFERDLLLGITGEIRNKVTVFRSQKGPDHEYFPRIEYVMDSFGNMAGPGQMANTGLVLHPGDEVTFACKGWDTKGEALRWGWNVAPGLMRVDRIADGDQITWRLEDRDIAVRQEVNIILLSARPYHRHQWYDDSVTFSYSVLPRQP